MSENDTTPTEPAGPEGRGANEGTGERPAAPTEEQRARPRRLLRSRDDRMIAGVAGGLGRYFAVDPVIVRIAFAISVFFGGLGALAYVALALFVPSGDADGAVSGPAPIERSRGLAIAAGIGIVVIALSWGIFDGGWGWHGGWFFGPTVLLVLLGAGLFFLVRRGGERSGSRTFGGVVVAVALGILAVGVLGAIAIASAWAGATGHGVAAAGLIVAIGVLLILSAFRGGSRWLIVPAVALALPLAGVAAADVSFSDGVGEREYSPSTSTAIPVDGYELGIGRLAVDLRELDWEQDTELDLDLDLGIGETVVAVPSNVCVSADVSARAGRVVVAGEEADGFDPELDTTSTGGSGPRLELHSEVDFGQVLVINDDDADIGDHGRWHDDNVGDPEQLDAALDAACAPDRSGISGSSARAGGPDRDGAASRKAAGG